MGIPESDLVLPEGKAKKGAKLFKAKCAQCHTVNAGGDQKSGPNLHGVVGAQSGQKAGYGFSGAVSGAGINWTDGHLAGWLSNPKKHIPGTKMVFAGLKKEQEIADVIAYMKDATA
jgi:cytochrome c